MSQAAAIESSSPGLAPPPGGPDAATIERGAIRPPWLRPAAIVFVVALHVAAALFIVARVAPVVSLDGIDVTLMPLGDSAEDRPNIDEVKEAEARAPAEQVAPEPVAPPAMPPAESVPELAAPLPQVIAPQALPLPVAKPEAKPLPKPAEKPRKKAVVEKPEDDSPTPAQLREQRRQRAEAADRRKAQAGQQGSRRGTPQGQAQASGMSPGAYAALLAAEVARHKVYPAAARAAQATGSVGVAFTVGASGRVVSHSITRSSGNAALDAAVHAMMAAVHAPPPPGGVFRSSTNINFSLH
ncbi:TonB family protein [uncultured Rhodoblastus sp.]|uniref:TonB family protein n=1 Tax=uncultured Rhodoblastus sp. TaxID=543037 RepID=UPI0025FD04E3|nr:TonB family protein [uncultured Rhodoblastus sp.]